MWWWVLIGCSQLSAPEMLLLPDVTRDGADGTDGPWGAALVETRLQARVSSAVPLDVVYPADDRGGLDTTAAPVAVLIHGGFVHPERYHWLAAHLASRGWVVVLPEADQLLAIAEPSNGHLALEAVRELSQDDDGPLVGAVIEGGPVVTMGHSLGGVMATRQLLEDPGVGGVAMFASFPAPGDPVEEASGERPVLELIGDRDDIDVDALESGLDRFGGDVWFGWVDGMNHYAWTDDPSDLELGNDGELIRALPAVRQDALRVLDTWLDVQFLEADPSLLRQDFPRVERQW